MTQASKPLEPEAAWPRPRALACPPADTADGPCVAIPARFSSPLLEIATWRCLRDDATLRGERYHAWPAFTFVHEGAFVMHSQGVSTVIDPGQVVFFAEGTRYSTTHSFGVGDRGLSIALHPDLFRELSPEPAPSRIGLRPARCVVQDVDLAQRLQAGGEPLALEEQALELVRDVWQGTARERAAPQARRSREEHRDLADRARAILARSFREPLRLAGLAQALHVSPFHLSRVFRQQTGLTLRRYLVRLRLLAAVPQTRDAASLSQLALELGFRATAISPRRSGRSSECRPAPPVGHSATIHPVTRVTRLQKWAPLPALLALASICCEARQEQPPPPTPSTTASPATPAPEPTPVPEGQDFGARRGSSFAWPPAPAAIRCPTAWTQPWSGPTVSGCSRRWTRTGGVSRRGEAVPGQAPPRLPSAVVYPFGGGDLLSALTAYPDATEITTISLEHGGDPRRVRGLDGPQLEKSLSLLRRTIRQLLILDDSASESLMKIQRGGIPGQLAFFLVGLAVHGYEPVSLRYFRLEPEGTAPLPDRRGDRGDGAEAGQETQRDLERS